VGVKYKVIKQAISKELAKFCFDYFNLKREVVKYLIDDNYISPYNQLFGTFIDKQVPNTYSHYADLVMETLLLQCQDVLEKESKTKLIPTYSYARIYKKGDVLHRHKDRFSCEISTTLNLGGDHWPIYVNPDPNEGYVTGPKQGINGVQQYVASKSKGIKIDLEPGDMLFYYGCKLEHWRDEFKGNNCTQVFLHYHKLTKTNKKNIYDSRPMLGLPAKYKKI